MIARLLAHHRPSAPLRIRYRSLLGTNRLLSTQQPTATAGKSVSTQLEEPGNSQLPAAPNRQQKWSESQSARSAAMQGPRFEQIDMSLQPQPLAAIEMINSQPIIKVDGRKACCDGGGGPLGHPKVFINLDRPGPQACGYCGLRFEQQHHH